MRTEQDLPCLHACASCCHRRPSTPGAGDKSPGGGGCGPGAGAAPKGGAGAVSIGGGGAAAGGRRVGAAVGLNAGRGVGRLVGGGMGTNLPLPPAQRRVLSSHGLMRLDHGRDLVIGMRAIWSCGASCPSCEPLSEDHLCGPWFTQV